jgi:hypothetical protein
VHSAAIRLTTSSGVNIAAIAHLDAAAPVLNLYRRRSCSFRGVIPEIDIWRAAQLMLMRYSEQTLEESAARPDELSLTGDYDGAATWRRIMAAIAELANTTPPGPLH